MKRSQPLRSPLHSCRTVVFLAAPNSQILDVTGPFQVFVRAAEFFVRENPAQTAPYNVVLVSSTRRTSVLTNCGLVLAGSETYRTLRGPIDTLLVAGGSGVEKAAQDKELLRWLGKIALRTRRIGSICTGAFLLAAAGLLDGKRAATHWKWAADLARLYPQIQVEPDRIFLRDGNVWTSAGITAGIDLALALIAEDLGEAAAKRTAQQLVVYHRRPGGQSQFSALLEMEGAGNRFDGLVAWARE